MFDGVLDVPLAGTPLSGDLTGASPITCCLAGAPFAHQQLLISCGVKHGISTVATLPEASVSDLFLFLFLYDVLAASPVLSYC